MREPHQHKHKEIVQPLAQQTIHMVHFSSNANTSVFQLIYIHVNTNCERVARPHDEAKGAKSVSEHDSGSWPKHCLCWHSNVFSNEQPHLSPSTLLCRAASTMRDLLVPAVYKSQVEV